MKKRYTAGTQKHVHGVIIFKEFNSNIYLKITNDRIQNI